MSPLEPLEGLYDAARGSALPLPYPDGSFTIVVSRFAFHHFPDPQAVLAEMVRVCASGGRILVCDVQASADPGKAAEFNRMEILRDPSHVRALPESELRGLFRAVGLPEPRAAHYELRDELENLLRRSFPNPGDDEKILAVPIDKITPVHKAVRSYKDIPEIDLARIAHFFEHYKDLEPNKWVKVLGWGDLDEAREFIRAGMARAGTKG